MTSYEIKQDNGVEVTGVMLFYVGWSWLCDLSDMVTFEQRPRSDGMNSVDTGGNSNPDRGNSLYKGGTVLGNSTKPSQAGVQKGIR